MASGATTAKLLHVDLTVRQTRIEEIPEVTLRKYLGGGALASHILLRELKPASLGVSAETVSPSGPLRILVVEDDQLARMSVVAQLQSQGHEVDTATNGVEGLDKFTSARFDLVITDRAMPEMGGDQLAAAIERSSPHTPVIMLTGFGDLMDARGERPEGVDAVIGKPVSLDALGEALRLVTARPAHR